MVSETNSIIPEVEVSGKTLYVLMPRLRCRVSRCDFRRLPTCSKACSIMESCRRSSFPALNYTILAASIKSDLMSLTSCLYFLPSEATAVNIFGILIPDAIPNSV